VTASLTGTVALITGASSGIGAATARRLAEHGAGVALVARRRDRLLALAGEIDTAGGDALVVEADITNRNQAEAAVQQAVEHFGRLDTLVNNAGLMLLGPISGADADEWERMIATTFRVCSTPPAPPSPTYFRPPSRVRAVSPTSSTSARSPAASHGTATASTTSPSSP
jgi:NADP-dependent 3-hydroxy acid dehydrogenase YdfG